MLCPIETSIRDRNHGSDEFVVILKSMIKDIYEHHKPDQGIVKKYILLYHSLSFEIFARFQDKIKCITRIYLYDMDNQVYVTLLNKSCGKVLRLAAIFQPLLMFWISDLNAFEIKVSHLLPDSGKITLDYNSFVSSTESPISAMAMCLAIEVVTLSFKQAFVMTNQKNSSMYQAVSSLEYNMCNVLFIDLNVIPEDNNDEPTHVTSNQPGTSTATPSEIQESSSQDDLADMKKILLINGMILCPKKINKNKVLSRTTSNIPRVHRAIHGLCQKNFGSMTTDGKFKFNDNICKTIGENIAMSNFLASLGLSISDFRKKRNYRPAISLQNLF